MMRTENSVYLEFCWRKPAVDAEALCRGGSQCPEKGLWQGFVGMPELKKWGAISLSVHSEIFQKQALKQ